MIIKLSSILFLLLIYLPFSIERPFQYERDGYISSLAFRRETFPGFNTAKYFILLGCDGMGAYWLQRKPKWCQTPNFDSLMGKGSFTLAARAAIPTISKPNWMSIITSSGPEEHGVLDNAWTVGQELPPITGNGTYFPSLFQAIKSQNISAKIAVYSDWKGFFDLFPSNLVDYKYLTNDPNATDVTQRIISDIISTAKAQVIYLHFDDVDHAGHLHGWGSDEWYKAVMLIDKCVGQIIDALVNYGMFDQSLIILTADHGGNDTDHGGTDMFNIPVPWFAVGPQINADFRIPSPADPGDNGLALNVRSLDTAATAVNALGYKLPRLWIGRVVSEIYSPILGEILVKMIDDE